MTVNSMAFEGDGCSMCSKAESDLITVSKKLECSKVVLVVVAVLAVAVVVLPVVVVVLPVVVVVLPVVVVVLPVVVVLAPL